MYIRKVTQIMLCILGVLLVLILIKGIENIMGSINGTENTEISEENEECVDVVEGGEYDKNAMFFEGFENVYQYFNSIKDAIDCENVIKSSLIGYGTPVRMWKVKDIVLIENILTFEIHSAEDTVESYVVTISEKGTVIERIR